MHGHCPALAGGHSHECGTIMHALDAMCMDASCLYIHDMYIYIHIEYVCVGSSPLIGPREAQI